VAAIADWLRGGWQMSSLAKLDKSFTQFLKFFVTALCMIIALILMVRVLIRFTPLHLAMSWTDEVVEWCMAWMIFTAATIIFHDRAHFCVDLLQTKLKGTKSLYVLDIGITILGIVFFAALLYYSVELVIGATQFSPILKVSMRLPYASIPVNCVIILCYLVRDLVYDNMKLKEHPATVR
jgi:TRAP-type C4-dicarboxylate transport system permease small subunit